MVTLPSTVRAALFIAPAKPMPSGGGLTNSTVTVAVAICEKPFDEVSPAMTETVTAAALSAKVFAPYLNTPPA